MTKHKVVPFIDVKNLGVEVAPNTIRELATQYKQSSWFMSLSQNSKNRYEVCMSMLVDSGYANKHPNSISPRLADNIYASLCKSSGVASAHSFVAIWGRIYKFAQAKSWVRLNPWSLVRRKTPKARNVVWDREVLNAFLEYLLSYHPVPWPLVRGLTLMYDTGQRPGDVLKMTLDMVHEDDLGYYIEFNQTKTGSLVRVPITKRTAELLSLPKPTHGSQYLVGANLDLTTFRYDFKVWAKKYTKENTLGHNLSGLQLRDLRRTALTEAGQGGATEDQMKALSGHKNRAMLDIYSVTNRQKALAALEARYANTGVN